MLILFGIAFIVIETRHNGKSAKINSLVDISYTTALMIGFFQLIAAVFPVHHVQALLLSELS